MHIYTLPELAMSPPFTAEKFRTRAHELQGQADSITDAIDQLIEIADAMDGTTPTLIHPPLPAHDVGESPGPFGVGPATSAREATPPGPADDDSRLVARDMTFPGSSVTITTLVDPASLNEPPPGPAEPISAAEAFARSETYVAPGFEVTNSAGPPPPPPPPPVPAADAETDDKGNPWIDGVHACRRPDGTIPKKADGTWKARRGGAKAPTADSPAIDLKTFQAAMGKLIAAGVDVNMITTAVSQTAFVDMDRTTGGIEYVLAADDEKLTGKAWQALKAIAVQTGNDGAV